MVNRFLAVIMAATGAAMETARVRLLWLETIFALIAAWFLVFVLPFRWTARLFGGVVPATAERPVGDAHASDSFDHPRALVVMRRLRRLADQLPWTSTCLVRAIAGHALLERRRMTGTVIRFGVDMTEQGIAAHAWLVIGTVTLLGGEGASRYRSLADLGRRR